MNKVLVLCTGNSCRSIMAEAMINHCLGDRWQAYSAGVSPSVVNPRALLALEEIGIETSGLQSRSIVGFLNREDLDLVITVCDNARESCPLFPKPVKTIHIGIDDPAPFTHEPDETALAAFRRTRDQIRDLIIGWLAKME